MTRYFPIYPTWNWVCRLLLSGQTQDLPTLSTFNNHFTSGLILGQPHLLQDRLNQADGKIRLESTSSLPWGTQGALVPFFPNDSPFKVCFLPLVNPRDQETEDCGCLYMVALEAQQESSSPRSILQSLIMQTCEQSKVINRHLSRVRKKRTWQGLLWLVYQN